jgi:hypothetical protein
MDLEHDFGRLAAVGPALRKFDGGIGAVERDDDAVSTYALPMQVDHARLKSS